ncbi:urease accessory protein UreE [Hyphomicrobium sp. B1]|uniref:urease accessory protein UreE n=1 Tax=Hyphomicrobium sp. B1 TaxID=3075651 RepID=UPI003C2C9FA1
MLRIDRVVGDRSDPYLREKLHDLSHRGSIDIVELSTLDLDRHRLRARTEGGEEIAIALPRDEKLFDGAVLHVDDKRAIVVRAGEQRWMRLSPRSLRDAVELGYHAGNLHWRVRFGASDIMVALDGPIASYLARIEHIVKAGGASVSEVTE